MGRAYRNHAQNNNLTGLSMPTKKAHGEKDMEPTKNTGTITKAIIAITKAIIAGERALLHSIMDRKEDIFPPVVEVAVAIKTAGELFKHFHEEEARIIVAPHSAWMENLHPMDKEGVAQAVKKALDKAKKGI